MNQQKFASVQGLSLGFVAGYVDTLGFVSLFGLFTAHVTGNFILIGAALADPSENAVLLKFLTFPAFILGVALARILIALVDRRGVNPLKPALRLELALLLGFMACGIAATPVGTRAGAMAMLAGLLGAAGMGAHSATSRLLLGHLPPTSMMTGNVTQIVIDAVDLARGARQPGLDGRFVRFAMPLLAFAVGCVSAAFAYRWFGFAALAAPSLILTFLLATEAPAAEAPAAAR